MASVFFLVFSRLRHCTLFGLLLTAYTLLAGCSVGPVFVAPTVPSGQSYTTEKLSSTVAAPDVFAGAAQQFVPGLDIPAQWWILFSSPQLNTVIEKALKTNPTLEAAQAALRAAQESVSAQQGASLPSVNTSIVPSRQKVDPNSSPYTLHTAQLSVSYVPDVFGSNRYQIENLQALAEVQQFQLQAAYLSLTSNIVAAAIEEASLRAQIDATQKIIHIQQQLLLLLQQQYALGDIAQTEVLAQQAALMQTEAGLPVLQKGLGQQRDLLIALTGGLPGTALPETFTLSNLHLPLQLPVSLPSDLLAQRPDIAAAAAQLHAASAAVGVASANMLPQITLSANAGSAVAEIGRWFSSGTGIWAVVGGLTQPLFAGGTLLHRRRAAEALLDQAAAQYRSTVVTAFQNVADSLRALEYDAQVLQTQSLAEQSAAHSMQIAQQAVVLGEANPQSALIATQGYQLALINLVQAQANRYADTAALFQAMGGGWWNSTTSVPQKK